MRRTQLTVLYDGDCGICTHTARALARLDSRGLLNLVALQEATLPESPPRDVLEQALHAVDGDGNWSVGGAAVIEICRRVPLLWPLGALSRLPLATDLVDALYRTVADNRQRLSALLGLKVCRVPSREVSFERQSPRDRP